MTAMSDRVDRDVESLRLEASALVITVDKTRGSFSVLEKASGTQWSPDPWTGAPGQIVLRELGKAYGDGKMILDTEVSGFGVGRQVEKAKGEEVTIPLDQALRVQVEKEEKTLRVTFEGVMVRGQPIPFNVVYELSVLSEETFQLELTRVDVGGGFYPYQLLFPLRHGSLFTARDRGYMVLPMKTGGLYLVGESVQRPDEIIPGPMHSHYTDPFTMVQYFSSASLTMSWFGARKGRSGFLCEVLDDWDAQLQVLGDERDQPDGDRICAFTPIWRFSSGNLGYPRRLRYTYGNGLDYVGMAKRYRRTMIEEKKVFVSRRMKADHNPNFDRLPGAHCFEFQIQTNVKEDRNIHPRLIGYSKLWYTFDEIRAIVRDFHDNLGIRRAMIILLGWNEKGTDNGYPDLWPPNQAAGGEVKLRELVDYCTSLGYLVGLHDCYMFFQEHSETAGEDLLIQNEETSEDYPWDGGRSYGICPAKRLPLVRRNIMLYKTHFPGLSSHYSDCIIGWPLIECHDPNHPSTRRQDKESREAALKYIYDQAKLIFGSENALEGYVPYCGFFYAINGYHMFRRMVCVPLWHLVFHECANHYWEEGEAYNRPGFGAKYDLTEKILYDILWANPTQWNFMCRDYDYWREPIREYGDLLGRISEALADVEMTGHRILSDDAAVQGTRFADGTEIFVNFRDRDWTDKDTVPARGFFIRGGKLGNLQGRVCMWPRLEIGPSFSFK